MLKMTSGQRHLLTPGQQNCQQNAKVGPTYDCYLGHVLANDVVFAQTVVLV